jgi:hypothetical protein
MDKDGIAGGMEFGKTIYNAIVESKCFVYFHSENSSEFPWALNELQTALEHNKKILPIRIDQTPLSGKVSFFLGMYHFFDLTDRDNLMQLPDVARRFVGD